MKKKFLLTISLVFALLSMQAKENRVDSLAVYTLDRMNTTMQSLQSCSFLTHTTYDVFQENLGYVKHSDEAEMYIQFPDKLKMRSMGDKGNRSMFYNGSKFNYYSFDKNHYASISASGDVIQLFDNVNKKYGIEFPAADFFYPDFADDVVKTGGNLVYLGITKVNGQNCFHIAGNDVNGTGFQFWIAEDDYFLPVKMVLVYKDDNGQSQFEAVYSDWKLNPALPASLFEFNAPPAAKETKMGEVRNNK